MILEIQKEVLLRKNKINELKKELEITKKKLDKYHLYYNYKKYISCQNNIYEEIELLNNLIKFLFKDF